MKFYSAHRPNDRVRIDGKQVSVTHVYVTEALQTQGKDGATRDELTTLVGEEIGGKRPQGTIGQVLSTMESEGQVVRIKDRFYLKECAPAVQVSNGQHAPVSPAGGKANLAPFFAKRKGKRVSVYASPRTYEDVVDVSLLMDGRWIPVPVFDHVRICIGEIPEWHPDQRWWLGVETVKFIRENGKVSEEHPAPKDYVTIAPE